MLVKTVRVLRGILLLEPACVTIKGGQVADLVEQSDAIFESDLRARLGEPCVHCSWARLTRQRSRTASRAATDAASRRTAASSGASSRRSTASSCACRRCAASTATRTRHAGRASCAASRSTTTGTGARRV